VTASLLVLAKAPVPGRVKTRLCPPCTPAQAAAVAAAALADTLAAVHATPAVQRTLVLDGEYPAPAGWAVARQRGDGLGARLAHAFADTARPGTPALLVGMDTPQVTPRHLTRILAALDHADAVIGPATDGGWWTLALRDPHAAAALHDVEMSTSDTCRQTVAALVCLGLRVAVDATLTDVDTATDACLVADLVPGSRFARAVRDRVPV
jgi:uncharacterized protein